jgi:YhcH/YjgK/YiaL family protein
MILDTLAQSARYAALHPGFARAFTFLRETDVAALPAGRHPIDGDRIYVSIDHKEGRGREGARLEAHRRYIDIQFTIGGDEEIGWMPLAACGPASGAGYEENRDIAFFEPRPETWLSVPPRTFAIFFPEDAHAPLGGRGLLKKAIVKVAV